MKNKPLQTVVVARVHKTPSERLRSIRNLNSRKAKIQDITEALISSGYTSLDEQAKALGLHRATVWTITKNKHKLGGFLPKRLSASSEIRIRPLAFARRL